MKVILKQNVPSLGRAGDLVKVNDGYARNLLIPKGLASKPTIKISKPLNWRKRTFCKRCKKKRPGRRIWPPA
jgi:Ribosomal protein L9